MKRLLLPAGALVLVVTACGAAVKAAPQATEVARLVDARPGESLARRLTRLLR